MAIDFSKIKEKVSQLSGNRKSDLWKPTLGEKHELRIVPWPDGNDGQPFKERVFYYGIGTGRAILAPYQFKKDDPVMELKNKLEADEETREFSKQFWGKRRYYAPVIVRGEEDQGVRLWGFGKMICQSLYNDMLADFGDITDIEEGRDITVEQKKQPGKQWADTDVRPRIKQTPLAGSADKIKEFVDSVPDIDTIYTLISTEEIEKRIADHLMTEEDKESEGTEMVGDTSTDVSSDQATDIASAFDALKSLSDDD